jgi:hypothetical protein
MGINLVEAKEIKETFTGDGIFADVYTPISSGKRKQFFSDIEWRLKAALYRNKPATVKEIKLSVFGFSRGAAQARAFSHFLLDCCQQKGSGYTFCDIPLKFQFMGLFDTVASVGLADSSPIGRGFFGWGASMSIPKYVEQTVHYVAGNEVRQNFPLSSAREGNAYPANCIEVVYPGAHSDVGGGYNPNEQGKAQGRAFMASQIPLVSMYLEARKAGVQLMTVEELAKADQKNTVDDLQIHPTLAERFKAYIDWASISAKEVQNMLSDNMRLYLHWRVKNLGNLYSLPSYNAASEQDRIDMLASNLDLKESLKNVTDQDLHERMKKTMPIIMGIRDSAGAIADGVKTVATHIDLQNYIWYHCCPDI